MLGDDLSRVVLVHGAKDVVAFLSIAFGSVQRLVFNTRQENEQCFLTDLFYRLTLLQQFQVKGLPSFQAGIGRELPYPKSYQLQFMSKLKDFLMGPRIDHVLDGTQLLLGARKPDLGVSIELHPVQRQQRRFRKHIDELGDGARARTAYITIPAQCHTALGLKSCS